MKKGAKIRPEQITRAKRLLQDLPERDERKTREEAAEFLEKDFRKALEKGYTPKEISAMLKNEGIIIPAYLVQKFLSPENENLRPKPKQQPPPTAKEKSETKKEKEKPETKKEVEKPSFGTFTITPDTPDEEL